MAAARLRPSSAFELVFREGSVTGGPLLAFRYRQNNKSETRWGFAVGKKLDRRATRRNRLRRKLRTLAAEAEASGAVPRGLDIVVLARNGAMDAAYADLRDRFRRLATRLPASEPAAGDTTSPPRTP